MRKLCLLTVCAMLVHGCGEKPSMMAGPPQKPAPAPELQKLSWLIGNWTGTAEMVSPSPAEMKKAMPAGSKEMPTSFKGGGKWEWALGGMFIRAEGWHEMGEGQKATYIEYITWDPGQKKYRSSFFSDWGEFGTGWMTASADGKSLTVKADGFDAKGMKKTGEGTMKLLDNNTAEWTWTENGPEGKMAFKGTEKKQP